MLLLLKRKDDAIRAELCPSGYQFTEYSPGGCGGGDIGVLYKDFPKVSKIGSGEKESLGIYLMVDSYIYTSRKLRIIVVYRRSYSEKHKVGIFVNEFSDLLDSIILSKQQLFVFGDFNIHVDVSNDPDALKIIIFIIILSLLGSYLQEQVGLQNTK